MTRFETRLNRLEAKSNLIIEPRSLLADRQLTESEAEDLMANWRKHVDRGACKVVRGVLCLTSTLMSEEEWLASLDRDQ